MGWNIFQSDEEKLHEDEVEKYVQEAKRAKHAEFGPSAPDNGCCILLGRCCVHHCVACRRGCVDFCAPIGAWWAGALRYWCPDLGDQCCELDPNAFLGGPLDPRSLRERRRGLWVRAVPPRGLLGAVRYKHPPLQRHRRPRRRRPHGLRLRPTASGTRSGTAT